MASRQAGSPNWVKIRQAFESGETFVALAHRFSLHRTTIARHARRAAWSRLDKAAMADSADVITAAPGKSAPAACHRLCPGLAACFHRPALQARLYAGLERRITAFANAAPGTAEGDVKSLTVLVQTLQRLDKHGEALDIPLGGTGRGIREGGNPPFQPGVKARLQGRTMKAGGKAWTKTVTGSRR